MYFSKFESGSQGLTTSRRWPNLVSEPSKQRAMSSGIFPEGIASPTHQHTLTSTTSSFRAREINVLGELLGCHGKESWTLNSACKCSGNYKRMYFAYFIALGRLWKNWPILLVLPVIPSVTLLPLPDFSDPFEPDWTQCCNKTQNLPEYFSPTIIF